MSIKEISKERFDSYHPLRHRPADNALTHEVAWFEDAKGDAIGVIVENKKYDDFAAVSFASENGFQAYDATVAISSFLEAKKALKRILKRN